MNRSRHTALVEWTLEAGDFSKGTYSRSHSWSFDGGARIAAAASPHVVPPPLTDPAHVDPEEAYIAAISSCHMLWFLDCARQRGHLVAAYRDEAVGLMGPNDLGHFWVYQITLRPKITWQGPKPKDEVVAALHADAHERCFLANSVKTQITVEQFDEAG